MERRLALLFVALLVVVVGLFPLLAMLAKSLIVDGRITFAVYQKLFADPTQYWRPLKHSVTLAGLTAAVTLALGVPLGLLLGKTDMPFRHACIVVLSAPLMLPPYVLAVCWFNVVAGNGLLAPFAPEQTLARLSSALFGPTGCVWVLVSAFLPMVTILTIVYLGAVNPRLEEAARMMTRWPAILRHITLPLILPGILFAAMLVFLLALGEVGVPMFLRYPVFPVETLTQFSAFYDVGSAAAAATPLIAIALLLVMLERRYLRDKTYRLRPLTPGRRMLMISLGRWRLPAALAAILVAIATVALPLAALVASSLSPSGYSEAWHRAADSLGRSLAFASIGATLLTVVGFLLAYLIKHRVLRLWRALDTLTLVLFTLPGTVVGIGLIALWNRPSTGWLYASPAIVLLAYLAQYLALASRISLGNLTSVPESLEEAAQLAGAPWHARLWHVVVPAAMPGVIAAWLIAFVFCMRDLGASMLVYPAGQDALAVRIFTLMANGAPSLISALCVLLVAVTLLALAGLVASLRVGRPDR